MALGSVSISTFIPGELEDLTGTVSIIPFTRAEIERLANKKAYPNGKVVWAGTLSPTYNYSSSVSLPSSVDYVIVNNYYKLTKGNSCWVSGTTTSGKSSGSTVTFSTSGSLSASSHTDNTGGSHYLYINCAGYQYY